MAEGRHVQGRRLLLFVLLLIGFAAAGAPAFGQAVTANAVKAAYLSKFPPFVDWPAAKAADNTFTICIVGDDPFGDLLDRATAGQKITNRPIVIRRLKSADADCQILYAGNSADATIAQTLNAVQGTPVLTITDADTDGGRHGIISFVIEQDHVRFDIDAQAAKDSGLVISSKLLGLARKIKTAAGKVP
jgi:YfiR/HmsC-like